MVTCFTHVTRRNIFITNKTDIYCCKYLWVKKFENLKSKMKLGI